MTLFGSHLDFSVEEGDLFSIFAIVACLILLFCALRFAYQAKDPGERMAWTYLVWIFVLLTFKQVYPLIQAWHPHKMIDLVISSIGLTLAGFGMVHIRTHLRRYNFLLSEQINWVIDELPMASVVCAPDGSVVYKNRRWYEIFKDQDKGPIEGWGWVKLVPPAMLSDVLSRWDLSRKSGTSFRSEVQFEIAPGKFKWFLAKAHPVKNDKGQIIRWVCLLSDIDDYKRLTQSTA